MRLTLWQCFFSVVSLACNSSAVPTKRRFFAAMLRVGIVVQVLIVIVGCALRMPWLGDETTFYECYDLSASSQEQNCPSLNDWNKFPCSSCTNCQFECKAPFNFQSQYAKIHNYSICIHPSKDEQRRWSMCTNTPAVRACVCT